MGYRTKNADLDRSLEDTIKLKSKRREPSRPVRDMWPVRDTRPVRNMKPMRETKPMIRPRPMMTRSNINNRVGKKVDPRSRPYKEEKKQNMNLVINSQRIKPAAALDPSQIVITKKINSKSNTNEAAKSLVIDRKPKTNKQDTKMRESTQVEAAIENKKTIVLICNLDPRATAQDVGETCSMFGPILSCDLLVDPMNRPLNEAEIEFVYPDSAEECVAKLDKNFIDGRVLRARLQNSATLPVKPRYSSRTVVASARIASNDFNDPIPAMSSQHASNAPVIRQQQNPYYQQYQQQFFNRRF